MKWRSRAQAARIVPADQADIRLLNAYRNLFREGSEDAELVLADLAAFCGFYQVEARGVDSEDLNHQAGRRTAFGRIFNFLTLTDVQLAALEGAAREESTYGDDPR